MKLIIIGGPTGAGKSALAERLAIKHHLPIISFDSRQCYKQLNIGTGKPNEDTRTKISYYFINQFEPNQVSDAGSFSQFGRNVLAQLEPTTNVVLVVGGSGLYLDALLYGFDDAPARNEDLRILLRTIFQDKGIEGLINKLNEIGAPIPLETENPQRLMRAIEKHLGQNDQSQKVPIPYPFEFFVVNPEREVLYKQINQRVQQMIDAGWEHEAKSLISMRNEYALKTVGYKEWFAFFDGLYTRAEVFDKIAQKTRNYAKRQITWFKKYPNAQWITPVDDDLVEKSILT